MRADKLLNLISDEKLHFFAAESNVNNQVKKLDGIVMFKLILFSMLSSEKASLRVMETLYTSLQFKMIAGLSDETTKYNSIRDRITTINSSFFEQLFHHVFDTFCKQFSQKEAIVRYDSTMIAISSKLVQWGMKVGYKTNKVQLKYTVGMKGDFPCSVKIFDTQAALNENNTIPTAILGDEVSLTGIVVFDRGVHDRKVFTELSDSERLFVTRINTDCLYKIVKSLPIKTAPDNATVEINADDIVNLRSSRSWIDNEIRLIRAQSKTTNEPIYFLTNILDIDAHEIASIYKQRWEIESFFKFLKQQLNLTHLVTRNQNGIKVMIYMTLILAILLIAYKKLNKVESYKIAKLKFATELEADVVKAIVIICGGNPDLMKHLFNSS